PPQRARLEACELIRDRTAAVRHEDLQRREILEHVRRQQGYDGDALFVDEVQRIRQALRPAPGRVDVAGDVELDHLLVERIPETVAEGRRLDAAAFTRVGVQQAANEPLLLDALLEIRNDGLRTDAGRERQAAYTAERVRVQLDLLGDDVVRLLDEPLHKIRRLAGHHLVRPRRHQLHVGADLFQLIEMRAAAKDRRVERVADILVVGEIAAAPVRAAVREDLRFVDVQAVGGRDVPVRVDDHRVLLPRTWSLVLSSWSFVRS